MNESPTKGDLARALAGSSMSSTERERHEHDFYSTEEAEVTQALLNSPVGDLIRTQFDTIHEPACGTGAISRVLEDAGFSVVSTDKVDRGYGETGVDFLRTTAPRAKAIITNPPFTLWFDPETGDQFPVKPPKGTKRDERNGQDLFLRHADKLGYEFVALFAKAQFWHAENRLRLWKFWRPMLLMPLTWRVDFTGGKNPTMDTQWIVWWRGYEGPAMTVPLPRPNKR